MYQWLENEANNCLVSLYGNKGFNLQELKDIEDKDKFIVPDFQLLPISYLKDDLEKAKDYFSGKKVAVRSSSLTEDNSNQSLAGAFETFLDVEATEIEYYIKEVQKHSLQKFAYKIPVVIQEMVEDPDFSGVGFSYDVDNNKPYIVINYHQGVGNELVSGEKSGQTTKIFRDLPPQQITDPFIAKVVEALKYIEKETNNKRLDIEFAYKNEQLYLLQKRPIALDDNCDLEVNSLISKYAKLTTKIIKDKDLYLGDMIDINPEELVGQKSILIKTFFANLFPDNSLKKSRKELGYIVDEKCYNFVLDKMYINLEESLKMFLPASLTTEEVALFLDYYKKLLIKEPTVQNKLDSKYYPLNNDRVVSILSEISLKEEQKEIIKKKFELFFIQLEDKLKEKAKNYFSLEKDLLAKLGVDNFFDLVNIDLGEESLDFILEKLLDFTDQFTSHARGAFYFSQLQTENNSFFKNNIYQNKLRQEMENRGVGQMKFDLPEGFDFLSKIEQFYEKKDLDKMLGLEWWIEVNDFQEGDVFLTARENLKFFFMILIREFGQKFKSKMKELELNETEIENVNFKQVKEFMKGNISKEELGKESLSGKTKVAMGKILNLPPVLNSRNNPLEINDEFSNGSFIGKGILQGEVIYVTDLTTLNKDLLTDKILVIENATPEIDVFLPYLKGIVTKNGWLLAHIAIRAREYNLPAVVGIGEEFIKIIKKEQLNINFEKEVII